MNPEHTQAHARHGHVRRFIDGNPVDPEVLARRPDGLSETVVSARELAFSLRASEDWVRRVACSGLAPGVVRSLATDWIGVDLIDPATLVGWQRLAASGLVIG